MTISVVSAWLAWGTRQAATGLRCVADLVESLAEGLDGKPASAPREADVEAEPVRFEDVPRPVERPRVRREDEPHFAEEDSRPLSGTRELIASTLDRARERYEATLAGSDPTKRRNR